jgi:hypothetical protein
LHFFKFGVSIIGIFENSENFNRKKPTEIKLREETEDFEERD